jgi:hypothetical protein
MSPLLDTHAWIWWLQGDESLTSRERSSLDDLPRDLRPCIHHRSAPGSEPLICLPNFVRSVPLW